MNITLIIESVGFLATLSAICLVFVYGSSDKISDGLRSFLYALLFTTLARHLVSMIEWSDWGWQNDYDNVADFSNFILSLLWIYFFYACLQSLIKQHIASSERMFRALVSNIADIVISLDTQGRIHYVSPSVALILKYRAKSLIGQNAFSFVHKDDLPRLRNLFKKLISSPTATEKAEFRIRDKNNKWHTVEATGKHMPRSPGGVEILVTLHDITEQRKEKTAREVAEQRLNYLQDFNPSIIYTSIFRNEFIYSFVSENFFDLTGYKPAEIINQKGFWHEHIHPDDKSRAEKEIKHAMDRGYGSLEYRYRHKNGSYFWIVDNFKLSYDKDGNPLEVVGAWSDTTSLHTLSDKLAYHESHDVLTGACNRQELEHQLTTLIRSYSPGINNIVCELDIDQFKVINDTCGHAAGDELLKQIAEILRKNTRGGDLLCRLGGDEFGILIKGCNMYIAETIAKRWLKAIDDFRFDWAGKRYNVTASIGLAPITDSSNRAEEILSRANIACLTAKEHGRNRVHIYDESDLSSVKMHGEMKIAGEIQHALLENRFCLYWQPIVPVNEPAKINQYEILIRMLDDDGNVIPPGLFLPAAEKYGLSTRIDMWVINTFFSLIKATPELLDNIQFCDINLSGQSLGNKDVFNALVTHLKDDHVPAQKICLEITETAVMSRLVEALEFMRQLKGLGCRFSLDDFGSGFSSFAYLKTLPVDFIKIDGSFVKNIVDDQIDFAFVKSINEIGRVMNKQTIAEFVENDAILAKLQQIGVQYAQGYGIGKPEPITGNREKIDGGS